MPIDTNNLLVSLAVLQNKKVPRDRMLAASVGAALIPGTLGLIVPLAVANAKPQSGSGSGSGTSVSASETLVRVPDVKGKTEEAAAEFLEERNLTAAVETAFIDDSTISKGNVFQQDPEAGEFVPEGSSISVTVSLGPKPVEEGDDAAELDAIRRDVEENTRKLEENTRKLAEVLEALKPAQTRAPVGTKT